MMNSMQSLVLGKGVSDWFNKLNGYLESQVKLKRGDSHNDLVGELLSD
jgi:hypothetical protein